MNVSSNLAELVQSCKNTIDLTQKSDMNRLQEIVQQMNKFPVQEIEKLALDKQSPLEFKVAYKILKSKNYVDSISEPIKVAVVFAMWGEQNRLLPKSDSNPNGEDLLNVKIDQLKWLFTDSPVSWHLYAVDDGCPHGSGKIAEQTLANNPEKENVSVLYLEKAVPTNSGPLKDLKSADDSRKGGAIIFGCEKALGNNADVVIYTDADNSVHLGQLGLLLEKHISEGFNVVLGNRKDPDSILVKQENRWGIGIKNLRHMQRMVGVGIFSKGILDSQAAFKLYHKDILRKILVAPSVYDFSFDSDWIACVIANNEPFAKVPFAFIDSFAESASIVQGSMTTWETLLKGLVTAVRQRGIPFNKEMAEVIDRQVQSSKDLDLIIDKLPPQLENVADKDLGNPEIMSPAEFEAWVISVKKNG
jgi:glycosyltransferase involved in cell wall biosynthesis